MNQVRHFPRLVFILGGTVLVALLGIAVAAVWSSSQQARRAGLESSRVAVALTEQSITRTLESLDTQLGRMVEAVSVQGSLGLLTPDIAQSALTPLATDLMRFSPYLRQILVLDDQGGILFDSQPSTASGGAGPLAPPPTVDLPALGLGEREAVSLGSRLRIGKPMAGRFIMPAGVHGTAAAAQWLIPVWIAIHRSGIPPLIVVGVVNPGHLITSLEAATSPVVTATRLERLDGLVLAEYRHGAVGWGAHKADPMAGFPGQEFGAAWLTDPDDGGKHLITFRLSPIYPVTVVQEIDLPDLMAHWWDDIRTVLLALGVVVLAVVAAVLGVLVALVRQFRLRDQVRTLSQAVEQGPTAVIITDPLGHITYVNRSFTETMGYTLDELRGQTPRVLKSGQSSDTLYAELWETITAGGTWHGEFHNRAKDGAVRWMAVSIAGVRGPDGALDHFVAVESDVTDRKATEAQLAALVARLDASNRELEQFAYVASHDLQEPLRMVTGYMSLLKRRYGPHLDAAAQEFIGFAVDGAQRMQAMIQDLLGYSRIASRGRPLLPLDTGVAVAVALGNLDRLRSESGARITVGDLPWVEGDESQLVSLFQNLIGNAMKYRDPARPLFITLEAHTAPPLADGTPMARFSLRDTGQGIPQQQFERVFAIFQRLHDGGEVAGSGIGLAICKKIVERHGGHIWIESQVGQGSTFHFTLRLAATDAPSRPSRGTATASPAGR